MMSKIISVEEVYGNWEKNLASRTLTPEISLPIPQLNNLMWGLHRQTMTVVAGRPSEGKTSFVTQIAESCANCNKNTYFLSLETSKESILERMFCQQFKVNNQEIRRGLLSEESKVKLDTFRKHIKTLPLLIVDKTGFKYQEIYDLLKKVNPPPDVFIIDYLQMISTSGIIQKNTAIEEYIRHLKQLSVEYNFALVVASQLNRALAERKDKRPVLTDLKGSGSIEEASDNVIGLYWNAKYEANAQENKFELHILKQRDGSIGVVEVDWYPQYYRFEEKRKEFGTYGGYN